MQEKYDQERACARARTRSRVRERSRAHAYAHACKERERERERERGNEKMRQNLCTETRLVVLIWTTKLCVQEREGLGSCHRK